MSTYLLAEDAPEVVGYLKKEKSIALIIQKELFYQNI
jgi:hypothetical protein